jgi:putative ABC transport system ATP-binding protein
MSLGSERKEPSSSTERKKLKDPVVELLDVSKSYALEGGERVTALRGVSLTGTSDSPPLREGEGGGGDARNSSTPTPFPPAAVRKGEFVMIRGPSGGGKTSLLNVIGTLDGATSGVVKLFGSDIRGLKDAELSALRLEKIGFVFQSFNLLSTLSAFENVELPMSLLGKRNKAQRRSAALSLLRLVGLESRSSHLPSELSGGEQQRVAIARALANEPDLLLLDEPTGDLDTAATVMIMDLLLKINTGPRKMTAVMVTHNPDLECYADRVLYVAGGTIAGVAVNEQQSQLDADNYKKFLERDGGEGDIDD